MNVGYEELQSAIEEEQKRNEQFVTLSQEVNELNTTVSHTNYQLMTIRQQVTDIQNEIKEQHQIRRLNIISLKAC